MTDLLDEAVSRIEELPVEKQNEIASWILAELSSEKKWQASFQESNDDLSTLADEALKAHESGDTDELDPDDL